MVLSDFDAALAPLSITVSCDFSWLEDCGRGPLPWHLAVRTPQYALHDAANHRPSARYRDDQQGNTVFTLFI